MTTTPGIPAHLDAVSGRSDAPANCDAVPPAAVDPTASTRLTSDRTGRTTSARTISDPAAGIHRRADGTVVRPPARFQGRLTEDGSSGFPAEAGRYHLYVSRGCSWSNRAAIVRKLLGLEEAVALTYTDEDASGLRAAWETMRAGVGSHRVPTLWDERTRVIVSNDADAITRDLATQFGAHARHDVRLYPRYLRAEIDETNEWLYQHIHSAVHLLGHEADDDAHLALVQSTFAALGVLDTRLATTAFLHGADPTESDVRLFVSLVRLEAAFPGIFEANRTRTRGYPRLWRYARELYALPAFGSTVDFAIIRSNFAEAFRHLHAELVVPDGRASVWS